MITKKAETKTREHCSAEIKKQALDRVDKDGIATVALNLRLKESRLYSWRQKRRFEGLTTEEQSVLAK